MEADSEDATSQSLLNTEYDQLIGGEDEIAATARTTGWQVSNNLTTRTTKREEHSKKEKFKKERKQSSHHNNSKDKENRRIH